MVAIKLTLTFDMSSHYCSGVYSLSHNLPSFLHYNHMEVRVEQGCVCFHVQPEVPVPRRVMNEYWLQCAICIRSYPELSFPLHCICTSSTRQYTWVVVCTALYMYTSSTRQYTSVLVGGCTATLSIKPTVFVLGKEQVACLCMQW